MEVLYLLAFIKGLNLSIFVFFTLIYSYRVVFLLVGLWSKRNKQDSVVIPKMHSYAVLVAARNEQAVIGELIKSIKDQNYPAERIDIFVVADNCTDQTASAAREAGATVYERNNKKLVGKGYALNFLITKIKDLHTADKYEGYFVFDADNLLDENFIYEMNRCFDQGYRVLTSYRNSKNYQENWITAGYALWFLHEAEYLNNPRMILGKSCAISGTGFLIHSDIIQRNGGWIHYLLTEDIEFSISQVIHGETIGYCGKAMLYDEQPATFEQSWNQRLRWAKGFYQVFRRYGANLLKGCLKNGRQGFSCYDMMMTIMPAVLVSIASVFVNGFFFAKAFLHPSYGSAVMKTTLSAMLSSFLVYYGVLFVIGAITTWTERKKIHCPRGKKIIYIFTFPLFMFTYIPIAVAALFLKVDWKPIPHTCIKSLQDVREHSA